MKLVIEIDEETYKDIKKGKVYSSIRDVPQESVLAIANGTPLPNALEYLETAYTGARACDDVAEQVRLARAIEAYKQDVHEDCTVLEKIRAEIETEKNAGCHTWYAGGLDFSMSIIDKYKAERSGTDAKEKINPYKKCKTCGQDKASCCGCPEVLELERRIRKEHKEC